jgi:phosphate transport system substrate-binding protein
MTQRTDNVSEGVPRRKFIAASGLAGAAMLAGCAGGESTTAPADDSGGSDSGSNSDSDSGSSTMEPLSGDIDIAGSSTVFPLATAFGEIFQQEHPDVNISVQSTGSGGGFANFFCPGETDFNNASRPIKAEEEDMCAENDVVPIELQVATDALTVIINNDNDFASEMTVEELQTLYAAETAPTTWAEVNSDWPDEEIELYGPTDASGTYDYFIEAIVGEDGPGHRQDYSATEQDRTIVQGVEGSELAVGYLGFAYYSSNTDRVTAVAVDNGDGPVEPSLESAKSGEYAPLSRPLFTYPAQSSLAERHIAEFAQFFVENTTNEEVVANDVGYVPLDDNQQGEQMDKLMTAIEEAN